MSAEILPDGSILFRLTDTAILFDAKSQSVTVEDLSLDPSEADTAFNRQFAQARLIWLASKLRARPRLTVLFNGDDVVDLGLTPNHEAGLRLACELGNLMNCPIEVDDGKTRLGERRAGTRIDPLEQETQRISIEPPRDEDTPFDEPGILADHGPTTPASYNPVAHGSGTEEDSEEMDTDARWAPSISDMTELFVEDERPSPPDPALPKRAVKRLDLENAPPRRIHRSGRRRRVAPHLDEG